MRLITLTGLLVAALVALPAATPASTKRENFSCIYQHGPRYTFTFAGAGTFASTTYFLRGFATTCSSAKHWVARLARQPYRGAGKPVAGGPPGWRCLSRRIAASLHPKTVYDGTCQNRKDTARVFQWGAQTGPDDGPVKP